MEYGMGTESLLVQDVLGSCGTSWSLYSPAQKVLRKYGTLPIRSRQEKGIALVLG